MFINEYAELIIFQEKAEHEEVTNEFMAIMV